MRLVIINKNGQPEENLALPPLAVEVATANFENYNKNGFEKPWCAYFALDNNEVVGTCAFKKPPTEGKVEIAYYTFPDFEGKGVATKMAQMLIQIAAATDSSVLVTAQTLPENNPSTSILRKLGFVNTRTVNHPEDGDVWEWELKA